VTLWGTGSPRREFLHVDDLAHACLFLMNLDEPTFTQLTLGAIPPASTLKPFVPQDKLRAPQARPPRLSESDPPASRCEALRAGGRQAQRSSIGSLPLINIGYGEDQTIREWASLVSRLVGYHGEIVWDETRPDGMPRKLLDISRLKALGWSPEISLEDGIRSTYEWYLDQFS